MATMIRAILSSNSRNPNFAAVVVVAVAVYVAALVVALVVAPLLLSSSVPRLL